MVKPLNKDKIDAVIYHGFPCLDGFGSAMIVWLYYKRKFGSDSKRVPIKYIGMSYGDEDSMPDLTGQNVIMLDFSFKKPELMDLLSKVKSFMLLDHHKTAQENLVDVPAELKIFDMKRSGVGITWDYFFPGIPMPLLFSYIQDRDLWTKAMPKVDIFTLAADMMERKFELFEELLDDNNLNVMIDKATSYAEYQKYLINDSANHGTFNVVELDGCVKVIAYCNTGAFMSDVGNRLFTKYPFADFSCTYYYDNRKDETKISLRSTDTRTDVSEIAKQFGGGGHRNAAGCGLKGMNLFPFKIIDRSGEFLWAIQNGEIKSIQGHTVSIARIKSGVHVKKLVSNPELRKLVFKKFGHIHWVVFTWFEGKNQCKYIYCNNGGIDFDPTSNELYGIQEAMQSK